MRNFLSLITAFLIVNVTYSQNCTSNYSEYISFETVTFTNLSISSNAHYWWNFGDGTGSNFKNPQHTFPENGIYLVTLFVNDTVSNCSDYFEKWITISMNSNTSCSPYVSDSTYTVNQTTVVCPKYFFDSNCVDYSIHLDGIGAANMPGNTSLLIHPSYSSGRFLMRAKFSNYFISTSSRFRTAYKTILFNTPSEHNYDDCSANFEFKVVEIDSLYQRVFCTSMNKSATSYDWIVSGFGEPIHYNTDTMSHWYPNADYLPMIGLTIESATGCRDTIFQQIHIIPNILSSTVGIINLNKKDMEIYPNPIQQNSTFKFENPQHQNYSLYITSITGQIIKKYTNITSNEVLFERKNLSNGVYIYQLFHDKEMVTSGKFILK